MPPIISTDSVQLARADAIGKALTRQGWITRREPRSSHPGAIAANSLVRSGVAVHVVTMGARLGQLVEVTSAGLPALRRAKGQPRHGAQPSWRLTAYDPPVSAVLAAATVAARGPHCIGALEASGWEAARPTTRDSRKPRATTFTYPGGSVTVAFHLPTYSPPCPHCAAGYDCGDVGGWIVTAPCFMEASTHTPESVIAAFVQGLPGAVPERPASRHPREKRAQRYVAAAHVPTRLALQETVS